MPDLPMVFTLRGGTTVRRFGFGAMYALPGAAYRGPARRGGGCRPPCPGDLREGVVAPYLPYHQSGIPDRFTIHNYVVFAIL
jgi:hypothetical protein